MTRTETIANLLPNLLTAAVVALRSAKMPKGWKVAPLTSTVRASYGLDYGVVELAVTKAGERVSVFTWSFGVGSYLGFDYLTGSRNGASFDVTDDVLAAVRVASKVLDEGGELAARERAHAIAV